MCIYAVPSSPTPRKICPLVLRRFLITNSSTVLGLISSLAHTFCGPPHYLGLHRKVFPIDPPMFACLDTNPFLCFSLGIPLSAFCTTLDLVVYWRFVHFSFFSRRCHRFCSLVTNSELPLLTGPPTLNMCNIFPRFLPISMTVSESSSLLKFILRPRSLGPVLIFVSPPPLVWSFSCHFLPFLPHVPAFDV